MSETVRALRSVGASLIWESRAWLCETLVYWSLCVRPEGYTPSFVEMLVEERLKT